MQHGHHNHEEHQEHDKHAGHSIAMFRNKFWISLSLTIPVLLYSQNIQNWLNFSPPVFYKSDLIPFILGSLIFFYGGLVFIKGAYKELRDRRPGMMTLISLAIISSYFYSLATTFLVKGESFFWELSTLITIMLLGHWMEMASIQKAQSALSEIAKLLPDKAEKLINGKPKAVLVKQLNIGDLVLVRPGARIPADGIVIHGRSSVNEAAITGESKPVDKNKDSEVIAGTINQDGSLTVKVTKIGENTMLAGIMRLIAEAQASKSKTQILADRAAYYLTIIAISAGAITFGAWAILYNNLFALERAVTVLIIACPHALGLAIPLVVAISTSLSAKNGLLIRKRLALENARNLDTILFDKTGTLTLGKHGVTDILPVKGYRSDKLLSLAASLEKDSEHIVGKGIVLKAEKEKIKLSKVQDFTALPGLGVRAKINDETHLAVSYSYVEEKGLTIPLEVTKKAKKAANVGKTVVYIIKGKEIIGAIALADMIREESKEAIASLKKLGIKSAMITGDSDEVAKYVANELKLDQYFAKVMPQDKSAKVKQLQENGQKVAMVGDGINDAPALTQANIGIAIGAGTDVAIKSADIILIKNDPRDVVKVIKLSKATYKKMVQNLGWATGYNIVAIPLAAGVLYNFGIILSPAVGAVLMSVSTIVVAINASLLKLRPNE
ncbi:MAG: heavy metal translocating P-type ATPase [bacterium]|nr:heavy metal translocating P-type ATPase [bacterium]